MLPFRSIKRRYVGIESANKRARSGKKSAPLKAQVSRLKRQVAALKPEVKISYQTSTQSNITNVGAVVPLSLIAEGLTDELRLGDTIKPVRLNLKVQVTGGLTVAAGNTDVFKFMIIRDKRSNGVVPSIAGASTSVLEAFTPRDAMICHQGQTRFKSLREYEVSSYQISAGTMSPLVDLSIPLSGTTTYIDQTAGQGGAGDNHYYLLLLTDATSNTVDFAISWQFLFTDA